MQPLFNLLLIDEAHHANSPSYLKVIESLGFGGKDPSKSDCLVLDFADEGHNLETIASLGRTIPEAQYAGEASETEKKEKRPFQFKSKGFVMRNLTSWEQLASFGYP